MVRKSAYSALAPWFEYLNDDCDYQKWSQYLILRLGEYCKGEGLDVGCGAGYFTRFLARQGCTMTGVDVSNEMLNKAQENAFLEGVRAEYVLADITKAKFLKKYDFAVAVNDLVNYLPKNKLDGALRAVYRALKPNGVFFFDVSSKRKFLEKIANTVSADDREDVTYLSFNKVQGDEVTMDVTVFSKRADGAFDRADETHVQYIYTEEEIVTALERNGFALLSVEGIYGEDKAKSDRICFLAQRRKV